MLLVGNPWTISSSGALGIAELGVEDVQLPKALPAESIAALLGALSTDSQPRRRNDWIDRALVLTALLAGLCADELLRANIGDLRRKCVVPSAETAAVPVRPDLTAHGTGTF